MVTIRTLLTVAYASIALCDPRPLVAQAGVTAEPRADTSAEPRLHCWRGQPAPTCKSFVITEFGFASAVTSTRSAYIRESGTPFQLRGRSTDFSSQAFVEVGRMFNRGPSSAIGATLVLGMDGSGGKLGAKVRYRRWLSADGLALDLAAGVKRGNLPVVGRATMLTGDVAINFSDYGALVSGVDVARRDGLTRAALFGGARLGSKPGIIATGLATIAGLAVFIAWATWRWE